MWSHPIVFSLNLSSFFFFLKICDAFVCCCWFCLTTLQVRKQNDTSKQWNTFPIFFRHLNGWILWIESCKFEHSIANITVLIETIFKTRRVILRKDNDLNWENSHYHLVYFNQKAHFRSQNRHIHRHFILRSRNYTYNNKKKHARDQRLQKLRFFSVCIFFFHSLYTQIKWII